jgi:hypothetical protein
LSVPCSGIGLGRYTASVETTWNIEWHTIANWFPHLEAMHGRQISIVRRGINLFDASRPDIDAKSVKRFLPMLIYNTLRYHLDGYNHKPSSTANNIPLFTILIVISLFYF